ncbi:MAG: DUF6259 domain-containing protein [Bacillota bacterium]|jgi:hypothetical protein|nr:DUF6259 domain-containing protein [Bacillota bacterium]NLU54355.1 hypothetical protein [Bacillota bacterium]HOA91427.1 DUF6259 domain-containing protein [Bacillota bacterium]HOP54535.1 DUF6259 domain-containing protein [Bacillota bacterium]HPT62328.1 DUF6259 domain-containing protein [Bacillota bacterium]
MANVIAAPIGFGWSITEKDSSIQIDVGFKVEIDRKSGALTALGAHKVDGPFRIKKGESWLGPNDLELVSATWNNEDSSLTLTYKDETALTLFFAKNQITGRLTGVASLYRFPYLAGLKVDNDELITTNNFGELIPDPVNTMKLPVKTASCSWHNYFVARPVEGIPGCVHLEDKNVYRLGYAGLASMPWLFYGNKAEGFYIASYDDRFYNTYMHIEGTDSILLALEKFGGEERFDSGIAELSYVKGDWHEAARRYRKWLLTWYKPGPVPEWVWEENGLVVHYDFKFQSGEICHRFEDIPMLFDMAKKAGFKHLYVSAWNEGGFDTLYPQFFPDLELGTIRDLKKGIDYVKANGGKISFYINTRIFNHRSEFYNTLGKKMAARNAEGNEYTEKYGKETFSCMCLGEKSWTKILKDTILWLVNDMGATGMYIDQVGSFPRICYSKEHTHDRPDMWSLGYIDLLKSLNEEAEGDPFFIMEGCGDTYSQFVGAQLVHASWGLYTPYGHPEIYKYTLPEIIHIDMVHPKPVPIDVDAIGLNPVQVSSKMFLLGTHFWMYDHVLEDPELWDFLTKLFKIRTEIQPQLRRTQFVDTDGLQSDFAKRYTSLEEEMILFYNPENKAEIELDIPVPEKVQAMFLGDEEPQIIETTSGKLPTKDRSLGVFIWYK